MLISKAFNFVDGKYDVFICFSLIDRSAANGLDFIIFVLRQIFAIQTQCVSNLIGIICSI